MSYQIDMRRFEYVPAAVTAQPPNTYLGVIFKNNTGHKHLWGRTRFNGITKHILPDRDLYIGRVGTMVSAVPMEEFDSFMVISPGTNPSTLSKAGFRYAMASPHHVSNESETRRNPYVKLFSDSGGFQLFTGASDWIDMDELATFYNRTVDYGVGLDIPLGSDHQEQFSERMCKLMLVNNKYLRDRLDPDVELYDVIHGNTLPRRIAFTTQVLEAKRKEKRGFHGLCVAGIAQNMSDGGAIQTIINGTVNMMYVLDATKGEYERYHVLGTTSSFFQFLYHVILAHDAAPYITADSTSYVLPAANNLTLNTNLEADHRMVTTSVPKDQRSRTLLCSCPVCSLSRYAYVYFANFNVNCLHNLYALNQQRNRIEETAQDYLAGKVPLHAAITIAAGVTNPKQLRACAAAVQFAEDCAQTNFKKAWAKHKARLTPLMREGIKHGSLFNIASTRTPAYKEKEARINMLLTKYEDFHAKLRKGKGGKAKAKT